MSLDFEIYAAKGNEFVRLVADELEVSRDKAGRIIRAVFHALRNRLSHEESFQLMAQLPMALKGVYVDGWHFDKDLSRMKPVNDFLDEVRTEDGGKAVYYFGDNTKTTAAVACIFKTLNYFVSEEEMNDIMEAMPAELKKYIQESIGGKGVVL